ncbi:hypothetical protein I3842_01G161200 [Carya illinoinensis]|uniref:Uncharacterized protein n=1 Tax=Carya illinoinensis TaxID=32201 RepID=A0A922FZN8_CARIL|nr:hypothetical protein I3842_01G161200 [Carya illinoinensis]
MPADNFVLFELQGLRHELIKIWQILVLAHFDDSILLVSSPQIYWVLP